MNHVAELRNERRSLEDHVARLAAQRERLTREREATQVEHARAREEAAGWGERAHTQNRSVEELRSAVASAESELSSTRARHAETMGLLAAARERESSTSAALRTMEDVATRFAGVSDGVRLLLTAGGGVGVRTGGVVADFVEASREVESAAEAYLQGVLPAVVVEDDGDASRAARLIRSEGAGRTMFVTKTKSAAAFHAAHTGAPLPEALRGDARVTGRLKDKLRFRADDGFVGSCIADAVLVDSLESALALHHIHPGVDYLAETGEVVYASGMIAAGGRSNGDHGLLAHNRKIAEAQAQLAEATSTAVALHAQAERLRLDVERSETSLSNGRRDLEMEGQRRNEIEMQLRRTDDESVRMGRRLEVLAEELSAVAAETARLSAELEASAAVLAAAEDGHARTEEDLHGEVLALDGDEEALRSRIDEEAAARADAAARDQRVEAARKEGARLAEMVAELATRVKTAKDEREAAAARGREAAETLSATEAELATQSQLRHVRAQEVVALEEDLVQRRGRLQEMEAALSAERITLDTAREKARESELARTRTESDRRFLDDLCMQELGRTADEAAAAAGDEALQDADEAVLDVEIAEIKAKVEAVGPVNLMAIDEFQALEERHAHLSAQQKDLVDAMASLRETIKRINRNTRELFIEAFETIRGPLRRDLQGPVQRRGERICFSRTVTTSWSAESR
jgi:chromosome segregation protein